MTQKGNIRKIASILAAILLLAALLLLSSCGEKLRYNVKGVKFVNEAGPKVVEYELTNSEINKFLDTLIDIDFSQFYMPPFEEYAGEIGVGAATSVYIDAGEQSWKLFLCSPYIAVDGIMYEVGMDNAREAFEFASQIEDEQLIPDAF